MKLKYIYILFFLSILIYACSGGKDSKKAADKSKGPIKIDASIAHLESFSNTIEANGNILASEYVQLKPEMSGRVVFLNIPEGKVVSQGTLLLRLNDEDFQAQLKKYKAQLDIAKKTEQRLQELLKINGLNRQEYDLALNQVQNIEADIDFVNAQIRKTEIRAPFTGTIGLRQVSPGAYVTPMDILATLQQVTELKVDFVLPENYGNVLKTGDIVDVVAEGNANFKARIIGVELLVNSTTRNIQFRAVFTSGNIATLRPGAFVKVRIDAAKNAKGILVPTNSIIPETRFKKMAVIKNNKIEMVNVETGFRGENVVEITSGLEVGDTFAVNGILYLKPGSEVQVQSIKQ